MDFDPINSSKVNHSSRFDPALLIGIIGSLVMIALAAGSGGSIASFINLPSLFVVIGGTVFVTIASFSFAEIIKSIPFVVDALLARAPETSRTFVKILHTAEFLRRKNALELEGDPLENLKSVPLLFEGMNLLVDSVAIEDIIEQLQNAAQVSYQRKMDSAAIIRLAAETAPSMGLVGTLIGLVQMLGNMNDPAAIGPGMAVALLTTFYGVIFANIILAPIASRLEKKAQEEFLIDQMAIIGTESIARQENPRRTEMLLNSILPSDRRIKYFD